MRHGVDIHRALQFLDLDMDGCDDGNVCAAKSPLATKIKQNPEILKFWGAGARTEVPIAGLTDGKFQSLRIDRMIVQGDEVLFLDYKTDQTRERRDEYIKKLSQYSALLARVYHGKKIRAHILWLHDWELEEVG